MEMKESKLKVGILISSLVLAYMLQNLTDIAGKHEIFKIL
jgi:hypothetical protein